MPPCLAAALDYARRGLRVHPARAGTKLPILTAWQRRATADRNTISEWWGRWSDAGVAITTGTASGVIVVDVDPRHDGDNSLAKLEREHGPLPETWRALTPGGGVHLYLRHPGGSIGNRAGLGPASTSAVMAATSSRRRRCSPAGVLTHGRSATGPTRWHSRRHQRGCSGNSVVFGAARPIRPNGGGRASAMASMKAPATMQSHDSPATCCATASIHT